MRRGMLAPTRHERRARSTWIGRSRSRVVEAARAGPPSPRLARPPPLDVDPLRSEGVWGARTISHDWPGGQWDYASDTRNHRVSLGRLHTIMHPTCHVWIFGQKYWWGDAHRHTLSVRRSTYHIFAELSTGVVRGRSPSAPEGAVRVVGYTYRGLSSCGECMEGMRLMHNGILQVVKKYGVTFSPPPPPSTPLGSPTRAGGSRRVGPHWRQPSRTRAFGRGVGRGCR